MVDQFILHFLAHSSQLRTEYEQIGEAVLPTYLIGVPEGPFDLITNKC